jgi:hypothetical protein
MSLLEVWRGLGLGLQRWLMSTQTAFHLLQRYPKQFLKLIAFVLGSGPEQPQRFQRIDEFRLILDKLDIRVHSGDFAPTRG